MDTVKYFFYDPKTKLLSFCCDGQNVVDGIFVNDKIKLQLERFGFNLNEIQK